MPMVRKFAYYTFVYIILKSIVITEKAEIPSVRALTEHEMRMSEEFGYSYADRLAQIEEELFAQGQFVRDDSPSYQMARFKQPQLEARDLGHKASIMLEATRFLKEQ